MSAVPHLRAERLPACVAASAILLGLTAPAVALERAQSVRQYQLNLWTTADGLPNNFIQTLWQTRDGYLWLGTLEGLARFDGAQWTVFDTRNTPELKHNSVVTLCEDRTGVLWIGTSGGGIARYREGRFLAPLTTAEGLPNDYVREIYEDREGDIWITAHDGGLVRYRDAKLSVQTVKDGLPSNSLRSVRMDRAGRLWVSSNHHGIAIRQADGWKRLGRAQGLPCGRIRAMYEDRSGRMWVGTRGCGLLVWTGGRFRRYTVADGLPSNLVRSILEDRDGNLWVGTETGGAARFREGRFERLGMREGLPHNFVRSLWEDHEGNLWLGTRGGLVRLKNRPIRSLTTAEGLTSDNVRAVLGDRAGSVWIGTATGLSWWSPQAGVGRLPLSGSWSEDAVRALAQAADGRLWVGTENGLFEVESAARLAVRRYGSQHGLPSADVYALAVASDGTLWVGTGQGLARGAGGRFQRFVVGAAPGNVMVRALLEAADGALWIGTAEGLYRWDRQSLTRWTTREGLGHDLVNCLATSREGGVWVGTRGGLSWVKQGRCLSFRRKDGLLSENVLGVVEQDGAWLWVSSPRGVSRLARRELEEFAAGRSAELRPVSFDTLDGMRSSECNGGAQPALWLTAEGKLWVPTVHGVAILDARRPPPAGPPPRLRIEGASAGWKALILRNGILEVPPGTGGIEVRYTGISLGAPERVRFRYLLEGSEERWLEAGQRRTAYYTNLRPGSYRFRVQAHSGDGRWPVQEVSLSVVVKPRFYQTTAFYLLMVAIGVGALVGMHRLRVQALRRRFRLVLTERVRIGREIHDTLMQGVTGVSLLLEAAAQKILSAPEQAKAEVERALVTLDRVLREARCCILELRSPHPPEELSVLARRLVEQIGAGHTVRMNLRLEGGERPVGEAVRDQLAWILREALTNVVRHSNASSCMVSVSYDPGGIELSVADDGRGFDPASIDGRHFGVLGMRERAEELGGRFDLQTAPGAGTRVTVRVPCRGM